MLRCPESVIEEHKQDSYEELVKLSQMIDEAVATAK
jgi:hypothetical protein